MPFTLDEKLVIAVTSNALFNLEEEDKIFKERGEKAYKEYQMENNLTPLIPGTAFHLIEKLLSINGPELGNVIEVILLSRNDPVSGYRILNSIENHGLSISRSIFLGGRSPLDYMIPLRAKLFLSTNKVDVRQALTSGYPAGLVLSGSEFRLFESEEVKIAFDFDGVIANDEAEEVYQKTNDLQKFHEYESSHASIPHTEGPLAEFFKRIARIRMRELEIIEQNHRYKRKIRISIVTARNAPSHHRVFTTLREWGVDVDEAMFLGGIEKAEILEIMNPHIFFDDQMLHLERVSQFVPTVHVPYGVRNK